jgi:hypothetical protein
MRSFFLIGWVSISLASVGEKEAYMKTLRKRHPNLSQDRIEAMAYEHLGWMLPETRSPPRDPSSTHNEIIRGIFVENPNGKNDELIPPIADRLTANDLHVDRVSIARQLSYLRRQRKDEQWEEYRRFTRA